LATAIDELRRGQDVHNDWAEYQQADVAQARDHDEDAADEFENFYKSHVAR
jgi:hypothetical protein